MEFLRHKYMIEFGTLPNPLNGKVKIIADFLRVRRNHEVFSWNDSMGPVGVLTCLIAALQSIGLTTPLLETGVGGIFTGAVVTRFGGILQGDSINVLVNQDMALFGIVCSVVRDDVLVARTSITDKTVIFANELSMSDYVKWRGANEERALRSIQSGQYHYASILNIESQTAVVLDMDKKFEASGLAISAMIEDAPTTVNLNIHFDQDLVREITDHRVRVGWHGIPPYPNLICGDRALMKFENYERSIEELFNTYEEYFGSE